MASKVEKLRQLFLSTEEYPHYGPMARLTGTELRQHEITPAEVDSLIAAVAEQERERIVRDSQHFHQHDDVADSDYISTHYGTEMDTTVADCELFVIPSSVLSPPDEVKK